MDNQDPKIKEQIEQFQDEEGQRECDELGALSDHYNQQIEQSHFNFQNGLLEKSEQPSEDSNSFQMSESGLGKIKIFNQVVRSSSSRSAATNTGQILTSMQIIRADDLDEQSSYKKQARTQVNLQQVGDPQLEPSKLITFDLNQATSINLESLNSERQMVQKSGYAKAEPNLGDKQKDQLEMLRPSFSLEPEPEPFNKFNPFNVKVIDQEQKTISDKQSYQEDSEKDQELEKSSSSKSSTKNNKKLAVQQTNQPEESSSSEENSESASQSKDRRSFSESSSDDYLDEELEQKLQQQREEQSNLWKQLQRASVGQSPNQFYKKRTHNLNINHENQDLMLDENQQDLYLNKEAKYVIII